ncbi:hypothetical protein B0H14DRAFT_3002622 [Mycena olivaceomarginata]|nr:hypothetical protein B0H14DRAFT_3002622 [Mycena olivaceomarginata]
MGKVDASASPPTCLPRRRPSTRAFHLSVPETSSSLSFFTLVLGYSASCSRSASPVPAPTVYRFFQHWSTIMSSSSTKLPSRGSTVCPPVDNAGTALLNATIDAEGEFLFCTYPVAGDCEYFTDDGFFSSGSDKLCPAVKASSSTATCAPVDNAGTALLNSTIEAQGEFLFCNYPVAGECEYFADDGFFSSGSDKLCPEARSNSKNATTHTSISLSTTRIRPGQPPPTAPGSSILSSPPSSQETTSSGRTFRSGTQTSGPSASARPGASQITTRKGISARVVAGISVALAILFVNILILLTLRVRRRRYRRRAMEQRAITNTISPFTMVNSPTNLIPNVANPLEVRSISAGSISRKQLESELLNAQETMVELERITVSSVGVTRGSARSRILRLISKRSVSSGGGTSSHSVPAGGRAPPDLAAQLQAAREQIDMLVTRIHALEANTDPWGMGMSDLPPPEYV